MPDQTDRLAGMETRDFFVPGTGVLGKGVPGTGVSLSAWEPGATGLIHAAPGQTRRDRQLRKLYLNTALAQIPRLLGAVDRNPYRSTYGCLDRQYWHYRTACFPSQMYQEGVLPLAMVYATRLPGNRWQGNARVRELAIAAMHFTARSSHGTGSCDDYYPFERALGAAVFSLQAVAGAYQVLELDDPELCRWLTKRSRWLIRHDESGHLANHQALAALGLWRVGQITEQQQYFDAARARIDRVLDWQSDEGWFEEYGGADPGYQTITIECLAKLRRLTEDERLDEPIRRAVGFARQFLHPDGSYGGEYGSRGTCHFYPHGMELLAAENADAADLADGFLRAMAGGKQACFDDDRMFAHRLSSLIEAYVDWKPARRIQGKPPAASTQFFPQAAIIVRRTNTTHTLISAARGGVFKHFSSRGVSVTDAGLIVQSTRGKVAVSQMHDLPRSVEQTNESLQIDAPLHWARFETASPLKQAIFHLGMVTVGRWCRSLIRRLLQRRLITGRRPAPIRLQRSFEFLLEREALGGPSLRVTDRIELTHPRIRIRRMAFGTDHQAAYVAAGGVYQESVLGPWNDLQQYVDDLNTHRHVTIVREL